MVFSGIPFLYYFLPPALLLCLCVPRRWKNAALVGASLFFYGWGDVRYLLLMAAAIVIGYWGGLRIHQAKTPLGQRGFLVSSLILVLGLLAVFKYAGFFLHTVKQVTGLPVPALQLALPIGISFYTFQVVSYLVDIYRKEVRVQRSFLAFAAYVSLFPQLIAGPIVRYDQVEGALRRRPALTWEEAYMGGRRFLVGLGKKVLLANVLGELCLAYRTSHAPSVLYVWVYAVAFTMHIYLDFSAYSDMAIGLGRLLGFSLPENFHYPYLSRSVTEFWRRWHMTLGGWFRDYVYIPLGGNQAGPGKWVRNILVVWLLTGAWHGAAWNFILWGLLYGILLLNERLWLRKHLEKMPLAGHVYTLFFVTMGFVLFNAGDLGQAAADFASLFGLAGLPGTTQETSYILRSYGIPLVISAAACTPLAKESWSRLQTRMGPGNIQAALEAICLAGILLLSTAYLVDGSFNPFLYFRF